MPEQKATATVVIFVTREGVKEVQVHTADRKHGAEGSRLYEHIRPTVDRLDRIAKTTP